MTMTHMPYFVSELIRAANEADRLTSQEIERLLSRATTAIRDLRNVIGIPVNGTDKDALLQLNDLASRAGQATPDEVTAGLLEAADMVRTLWIVVDSGTQISVAPSRRVKIREAYLEDAGAMSDMLQRLVAAGERSARADTLFVEEHYIDHPAGVRCSLAEDGEGNLLGFQALIRATEGNPYDTPIGWGIVGTHVSPDAARTGVGRQLFEVTRQAAIDAGIQKIEAFIGLTNEVAQAYYERMGFRTYRTTDTAVCKYWSADGA